MENGGDKIISATTKDCFETLKPCLPLKSASLFNNALPHLSYKPLNKKILIKKEENQKSNSGQ